MLIPNTEEIGKRVLEIRTELHLTRESFGKKVGVKGSVIQNIEQNRNKKLNEPLLSSIATEYEINKDWLLYGKGSKYLDKEELLKEMKEKYNLSNLEYKILWAYLSLDSPQRKAVEKFVLNLQNNIGINKIVEAAKKEAVEDIHNYKEKIDTEYKKDKSC